MTIAALVSKLGMSMPHAEVLGVVGLASGSEGGVGGSESDEGGVLLTAGDGTTAVLGERIHEAAGEDVEVVESIADVWVSVDADLGESGAAVASDG